MHQRAKSVCPQCGQQAIREVDDDGHEFTEEMTCNECGYSRLLENGTVDTIRGCGVVVLKHGPRKQIIYFDQPQTEDKILEYLFKPNVVKLTTFDASGQLRYHVGAAPEQPVTAAAA